MMKKFLLLMVVSIMCLAGTSQALFVMDNFNELDVAEMRWTASDSGVGFAPGSGWHVNTSTIRLRDRDLTAPSSTNFGLTQTGNTRLVQGTYEGERQQARQIAELMDGTVWFSFLYKHVSEGSGGGLGFNRSGYSTTAPRVIADQGDLILDFSEDEYDVVLSDVLNAGETYLIVGRIEVDAGDNGEDYVSVWLNPDVTNPGMAAASQSGADFVGDGIDYLCLPSFYTGSINVGGEIDMVYASNDADAYKDVTGADYPSYAYSPTPSNGQNGVGEVTDSQVELTLSWKTGADPDGVEDYDPRIKKHYVYLNSADEIDPNNPDLTLVETVSVTGADASSSVLTLDLNGQYYWLVEEGLEDGQGGVYPAGDENNFQGELWSFQTKESVPVIEGQPEDQVVFEGETANFEITAASEKPITNYQWYKSTDDTNQTPADDTALDSGASLNLIAIENAAASDEGYYYCVVSNSAGDKASQTAVLGLKKILAHWTMNQSDVLGGELLDVQSGNNAVIQGTPEFAQGADGAENGALVISEDVYASAPGTIDPPSDFGMMSLSVWVNWHGPLGSNYQRIISKSTDSWSSTNSSWTLGNQAGQQGSGNISYYSYNAAGTSSAEMVNDQAESPDTFQHYVLVYDGQEAKTYFDGQLAAVDEIDVADFYNQAAAAAPIAIGAGYADDGAHRFNGALDDIRIYNYSLSADEVGDLYYDVTGEPACVYPVEYGDYDNDCDVDVADLMIFIMNGWLDCGLYPEEGCM
ncbi:Immunoglobulin I-set domain protein [Sedimentisphaera cyanobacteriorum]|uniref:Immunoglobulin I-set domain protein n=1 Tax=Sedimentisphaera cyanobacteriorum TaxID=1940790 RepID=A0A1Q2HRE9_9BACT|nr:LamG-like jellyroll fold domain-containing protein [Sedimentisphaera cyanobacteriorum]AQQ10027.1 Immunoglobulin I-set domain protein [Sedimentisphaera cyanobacteriorum]